MTPQQSVQNSQDAMEGVEFAPVPRSGDDLPLPSVEMASAPASNPEDVDNLVNAPLASSSVPLSRTSSVGLGIVNTFLAREKSKDIQDLRQKIEGKIQAYKSPFGPPPVATRQPSIPRQSSLSRQTAHLPSMTQSPSNPSRNTRTPLPSMTQAPAHNNSYGQPYISPTSGPHAQQFGSLQTSMNTGSSPYLTAGSHPPYGSPYGFPQPPPFQPPAQAGFQQHGPSSRLPSNGQGNFAFTHANNLIPNGHGNAALTTGFVPTSGSRSQDSAPPPSSLISQSENRFMPAVPTLNGKNTGHASNGGFVPTIAASNNGDEGSFFAALASAVDNTIRQISAETELHSSSRTPGADPRGGEVIDGNSQLNMVSGSATNNDMAAPNSQATEPLLSKPTEVTSLAATEEVHSIPKSVMDPITKPKKARGRPKKNVSSTNGKGKGKGKSAAAVMPEQLNSVLPSIESGEFAESFQNQRQSNGFMPANEEPETVAPTRVSESAQPSEPTLPDKKNEKSSVVEQASTESTIIVAETSAIQAKPKRAYNRRKKVDLGVTNASVRMTRASSKEKTPADEEHGAAGQTAPIKSTGVSSNQNSPADNETGTADSTALKTSAAASTNRKSPADSGNGTTQSTAPVRATRASRRNETGEPIDNDLVEPIVEESRKKRKYNRKKAATAPIEGDANAPEQQPVLEVGGIEGIAIKPIPTPEQHSVTTSETPAQPSEIQSPIEDNNQIIDQALVSEEQFQEQEIVHATPFQADMRPAQDQQAIPNMIPSANFEQVLDQCPVVQEQAGEGHSNGISTEGAVVLDDEEIPIVGDIEQVTDDLPAAPEDDSEPVTESRSKRKRTSKSVEVDLEEPLAKRVALTEDQPEMGDAIERPKPPKRAYNKKKKAAAAEAAAQAAADEEAFGIPCALKGEEGHLVLTAKKTLLEFFAITQHPPELEPRYSLLIADLTKRPITSARKSNPMCIRLKGKTDPRGSDFAFAVAQTDEGYTAMHEMRSRIVAASLQSEFQPNPEVGINARLYQCEKCGLTFKNPNGKEYHLEKSQSVCNPNYDPSKSTNKRRGGRQKGIAPKAKKGDLDFGTDGEDDEDFELDLGPEITPDIGQELDDLGEYSVARPAKSTRAAKVKTPRKKPAREASPESEDSIYAWAEATANGKTATGGNRRTTSREASTAESRPRHKASSDARIARKSARRYKNLQGEAPFLAAVAQELANQDQLSAEATQGDVIPPVVDTQLTTEVCEKLIVDLVAANNGLFPGDKSMWFAFVAVWWKDFKSSKLMPESKRCSYLLDDLVETGRLRKLEFSFRDKKSRDITRAIYVSPDYNEDDESLGAMKESIKAAHPIFYVPEGAGPPQHILEPLEKLVTRPPTSRKPKLAAPEIELETSEEPEMMSDPFDEDEYQMEDSASLDDEDFLLDMNIIDSIEEDIYEPDGSAVTKNAKIAASIRKWHEKRKALGLKAKPRKYTSQPNRAAGPPVKRGLTKEEREKLYLEEASSPCWGAAAPAFMQDPATGTWGLKPVRVKGISTAISSRPRGIGAGFAEPITYLQSENGAWNHRAYGHGVKPIYSRPSKFVAGNPAQAAYLAKIQGGFRPIVYPTKNRVYGPAPLTKSRAPHVQKPKGKRSANRPSPISREIDPDDPSFTPIDLDSGSDFESTKRHNIYKDLVPDSASRPKRRVAPKVTKTPTPASGMDEIDILNYIEPKKITIGSTQNPGLTTLPSTFNAPMMSAASSEQVEGAANQAPFSFPQIIATDSDLKDGSWVSNKKGPRKRTYDKIRFDEQTAFTLETLPYEQLEDLSDVDEEEKEQPPLKRLRFTIPKSAEPDLEQVKGKSKVRVKKLQPTRAQTALAVDFDGLTEDPAAFANYNGVQMLPIKEGDQVRKRLRIGNRMTRSEEKRFVVTVIVIRIIAGGIDQFIDWVLVATLFPEFSMNYLSKNWAAIAKKKQDLIDELVVDFQEAFLVGYRDGKIKSINFNDLLSYDWARLVRWTMKNVNTSLTRTAVQLPADREDLNEDYVATEVNNENGEAQKMYFGLICPIYRRLDAVAARQMTTPLKPIRAPGDNDISELMKAKSFARSSALTPIETWDFHAAKDKLTQLSDDVLEAAIDALKEDKVIIKRNKARSTTGRIYEASDAFAAPLRKPIKSEIYLQAYRYKEFLDASFRSGAESIRVDYFGDEGSYMCVTSLMATGRLNVTGINIPIAPMGLGDDAHPYDTKRIPKAKMRWDIEMSPSPTYLYNEDNETLQNITEFEPPSSRSGSVPAWNGIHDMVIPNLWKRVLCALISTVALRTGISKKMLRLTFKPTLEEWEIGLFMKWCEEVGFVERLDEDENVDGWLAGEWFWLCLGRMVEFLEEMEEEQRRVYEESVR